MRPKLNASSTHRSTSTASGEPSTCRRRSRSPARPQAFQEVQRRVDHQARCLDRLLELSSEVDAVRRAASEANGSATGGAGAGVAALEKGGSGP